jgi:predicted Zn-dependent protease
MANIYFWTDDEQAVIRQAMEDINVACGRELMRENLHTPAVTLHNKKLAFFEAELIGEGILGLADPDTRSAAFYPMAFLDLDMLRSVAIHEVFHVLGLRHTNEPGSIMRPYMEAGETISRYDVRSLNGFGWQCK